MQKFWQTGHTHTQHSN
uniref:Uncharacterized protein n=1 Tax=Rhizophora mucronata TaxID=61149 RepID=A0A2P2N8G7_RHIMU